MLMQAQAANDVIDHLASKLAVPTAHLWAILTRQAYAQIVPDVLLAIIAVVCAVFWWKWYSTKWGSNGDFDHEVAIVIVGAILAVLTLVATISLVIDVQYLFNPEYFALHTILEALKPK